MKIFKATQLVIITIAMGCGMSGCGRGIFSAEPFVDAKKNEEGKVILLNTQRMWQDFRQTIDFYVADERAGKRPPGVAAWKQHWLLLIKENQSSRENATKYITYMVEARRKAGLPELWGYP